MRSTDDSKNKAREEKGTNKLQKLSDSDSGIMCKVLL
jgi:hypothetical protein